MSSADALAIIHLRVGSGISTIGIWLVPMIEEEEEPDLDLELLYLLELLRP